MKKILYVLMLSISITLVTGCSGPGGWKKEDASSMNNFSETLVSKKATDYDVAYGYEVLVNNYDSVSSKTIYKEIWVPRVSFEKMPEPNDTTKVILHYLQVKSNEVYLYVGYDIQYIKK